MATSEELRERLRAKRDAQLQQAQYRVDVHAQARQAVQDLIILGYNFAQIIELTNGEVSAEHLDAHYKAIGYFRRKTPVYADQTTRSSPEQGPPEQGAVRNDSFGTPRWLENSRNYTVSLEESEPESASESEFEASESEEPRNSVEQDTGIPPASDAQANETLPIQLATQALEAVANARADDQTNHLGSVVGTGAEAEPAGSGALRAHAHIALEKDSEMQDQEIRDLEAYDSMRDSKVNDLDVRDLEMRDLEDQNWKVQGSEMRELVRDSEMRDSEMQVDTGSSTDSPEQPEHNNPRPDHSVLEESDHSASKSEHSASEPDHNDSKPDSASDHSVEPDSAEPDSAEQGEGSTSPAQAGPDSESDSSSDDEHAGAIQKELHRVQEQIRAMQQRKLEKTAQREAEASLHRRTSELSAIASRRAALMRTRHSINIPKLTMRVSRLEAKLKSAKDAVLNAAVQLKDVNSQSVELEKQEIQLRNELARPAAPKDGDAISVDGAQIGDAEAEVEAEVEAEAAPEEVPVKVLTALDSPLRMFSSWRLAPLGPRHWFSPTFNGRFVKDLDVREFCNLDLSGEECTNSACEYVHYQDFEVSASTVLEYLSTRGIARPGFKQGLIDAIRSHIDGPEASVDQLAAVAVGFRQQYDASQVLDWDAWAVPRPL